LAEDTLAFAGGANVTAFTEELLSGLLAPPLVRNVAEADDDLDAEFRIVSRIQRALHKLLYEKIEPQHRLGVITDFGIDDADCWPVTREQAIDDPDYVKGDAGFHIFELHNINLPKDTLQNIVHACAVEEGPTSVIVEPSTLIRLDPIDHSVYKALIAQPELLTNMNWRKFEELLASLLTTFGYEIELQRRTKDGGVDLFALKRNDLLGPQRYLLQAKRWKNKVGVEPVQQLAFLHSHHRGQVTKVCLATTSTFTRGAWELGRQYRYTMDLRDLQGLTEWIKAAAKLQEITF
jgi:HJR/Mrr/RecB family endonuclease